jgi:hypothetical protein
VSCRRVFARCNDYYCTNESIQMKNYQELLCVFFSGLSKIIPTLCIITSMTANIPTKIAIEEISPRDKPERNVLKPNGLNASTHKPTRMESSNANSNLKLIVLRWLPSLAAAPDKLSAINPGMALITISIHETISCPLSANIFTTYQTDQQKLYL